MIFLEEPAGCGGQTQRENSSAFIGHGAWNWRCHVGENDCVFLKSTLYGAVPLLVRANRVTENTIAYFETRNAGPDRNDLAGEITAEDEWVFDPGKQEVAGALFNPINGIDGDCVVLNDDLVLTRGSVRRGLDLEFGVFRYGPGGCISGHSDACFSFLTLMCVGVADCRLSTRGACRETAGPCDRYERSLPPVVTM
jgi:hypothetical protein